jgi:pyrroline-5-carboxylate reductase
MGIAVLSGVLDSLDTSKRSLTNGVPKKWEVHTPGTLSPVDSPDAATPSRFIACVSRESSAKKLVSLFGSMGELAKQVEVLASKNVDAVKQSDVVLLWYVYTSNLYAVY